MGGSIIYFCFQSEYQESDILLKVNITLLTLEMNFKHLTCCSKWVSSNIICYQGVGWGGDGAVSPTSCKEVDGVHMGGCGG